MALALSTVDFDAINTRFNPTVNGDLHLGHLYLCLVNAWEAHSTGGKFSVRFDDAKDCTYTWASGDFDMVARYRERQLADLEQFVKVDFARSELEDLWRLCQIPKILRVEQDTHRPIHNYYYPEMAQFPGLADDRRGEHYPCVPHWTAEKDYLDMEDGINWLIRGDDLISEFSLYQYFCQLLDAPLVRHTYMPRLQPRSGRMDTISKSQGGFTIWGALERYGGPDGVMEILGVACLKDPDGHFSVDNIKPQPALPAEGGDHAGT